jgi:hypothetical protein
MYKSIHVNSPSGTSQNNANPSTTPKSGVPPPRAAAKPEMKQDFLLPKLTIVKDPRQLPLESVISNSVPTRSLQMYQSGSQPKVPSRKVDSKAEIKGGPFLGGNSGFPRSFGTTFMEASRGRTDMKPEHPTIPKINPVLDAREFNQVEGLLVNRSTTGKILGSPARHYMDAKHVPVLTQEEQALGPQNPYQQLNEVWTKCWDDEAKAVYYFNSVTGEATWVQPEL